MSRRRSGFTLLELIVVMAILLILGSFLIPTLTGMKGNTGVKAGADSVRARMFDARARAMEDGVPYRLSVSEDGKQLQVGPDDPATLADADPSHNATASTEQMPDGVIAKVTTSDGTEATVDQTGWIRVATFTADGTCREDLIDVVISEPGSPANPITVRIRGVTGSIRTLKQGAK